MLDIKQIALEVARMDELMGPKDTFAFTKDRMVDFATRFLAAINAKAEPVAEVGAVDGYWWGDRPKNGTRLFTHPTIEPAGEVVVTTTEEGRCVCVTRQDEEGRILKVLWEAPAIEPAQQAAFDQEIKDADELLRLLNLPPDRYRTECGFLNIPKVKAAVREPWDYPTIEPVNPPALSAVGAAQLPDAQLCQFYDVDNFPDLVSAMDHHIEKLQSKLPPTPSLWPGRVREG